MLSNNKGIGTWWLVAQLPVFFFFFSFFLLLLLSLLLFACVCVYLVYDLIINIYSTAAVSETGDQQSFTISHC